MKEKEKGFILIIVTVLLSVIALLVLCQMEHTFILQRTVRFLIIKEKQIENMESVLKNLIDSIAQIESRCFENNLDESQIIDPIKLKFNCCIESKRLNICYIIKNLSLQPALITHNHFATQHWVVTLYSSLPNSTYLLQVRVAKETKVKIETTEVRVIKEGIQSWRLLSVN